MRHVYCIALLGVLHLLQSKHIAFIVLVSGLRIRIDILAVSSFEQQVALHYFYLWSFGQFLECLWELLRLVVKIVGASSAFARQDCVADLLGKVLSFCCSWWFRSGGDGNVVAGVLLKLFLCFID